MTRQVAVLWWLTADGGIKLPAVRAASYFACLHMELGKMGEINVTFAGTNRYWPDWQEQRNLG